MSILLAPGNKKNSVNGAAGEPTWGIASFYPIQGTWTEDDYLELERSIGNRMIELSNGCLEILAMPDLFHQLIVQMLWSCLDGFIRPLKRGLAAQAPLPVRLGLDQANSPRFRRGTKLKKTRNPLAFCGV